jgi:hypothetical protein
MKKPTLNITDFLVITAVVMAGLAIHQKFVAPRIAPKK